ncbi:Delta-latroinsectotoxin [Dactylellina cionopaga]|nr:Delta-latroinsectotoxin [Dactylellina cionopaga]
MAQQTSYYTDHESNNSQGLYGKHDIRYSTVPVEYNPTAPYEPRHTIEYPAYNTVGDPMQYAQWNSQSAYSSPVGGQYFSSSSLHSEETHPAISRTLTQGHFDVSSHLSTPATFLYNSENDQNQNASVNSGYTLDNISSAIQAFGFNDFSPGGFAGVFQSPTIDNWSSDALAQQKLETTNRFRQSMDDRNTTLQEALKDGNKDLCRDLILQLEELDERNSQGYTAVHFAAAYDRPHLLSLLLESGADPKVTNNEMITPLHLASLVDSVDCVDELLNYVPEDWELNDDEGCSPYDVALKNGSIENINFFLEIGARIPQDRLDNLISSHEWPLRTKIRQLVADCDRTAIEKLRGRDYPQDVKAYVETLFNEELADAYDIVDGLTDVSSSERDDIKDLLLQNDEENTEVFDLGNDDTDEVFAYPSWWNPLGIIPLSYDSTQTMSPANPQLPNHSFGNHKDNEKMDYFDEGT